jgi:hypothetical protein
LYIQSSSKVEHYNKKEMSALSELQQLEKEMVILKKILKGCNSSSAELTSVAAARICSAIAAANGDPLADTSSGSGAMSSGGGGGGADGGGCCVVC